VGVAPAASSALLGTTIALSAPLVRQDSSHVSKSVKASDERVPFAHSAPHTGSTSAPLTSAEVAVELRGVSKQFGEVRVLRELNLAVQRGEILALLGPSGSGKSTVLNLIAGFFPPDEGHILLDGELVDAVPTYRRNLGMVFQSYSLFPHMNVFDNVAFGLTVRRLSPEAVRERVSRALDLVRLQHLAERFPAQLSGGQQQRIAVARALVVNPRVLLCDEPLSNLDAKLRKELQVELRRIQRDTGITMIYVTHDQEEAVTLADRIGLLDNGTLEQLGDPHTVFEFPRTRFVAEFMGYANVFVGEIVGRRSDHIMIQLEDGPQLLADAPVSSDDSSRVAVCIREERIGVGPTDTSSDPSAGLALDSIGHSVVLGRIETITYTGLSLMLVVRHSDRLAVRVRLPIHDFATSPYAVGSSVRLTLPRQHLRVIPGQ